MTHNTIDFPHCFSEAKYKLRMKFRGLDNAIIEDSIQHARIEYWRKGIASLIPNESEALGWFLNVAHRYLYKEIIRLNRNCSILYARDVSSGVDLEKEFFYKDLINSFDKSTSKNKSSTLIKHAIGYSLKEMAELEHISLNAMKQTHAREKRIARQQSKRLFY
jgi:hypothetical protein